MELIFSLFQQLSVYLVIAYLLSKTPLFIPLTTISGRLTQRLSCYVVFSSFCILGTYFGLAIGDAIANTRAIGAVMGGILGGPFVGFAVGLTGGLHRYSMGGFTDLACAVSTTAEGLIGGLIHLYFLRKNDIDKLYKPGIIFMVTLLAEVVQMMIILIIAKPFEQAASLVEMIAVPMMFSNALGAALFMSFIDDKKRIYDKYSTLFSNRALKIAQRSVGILHHGFNQQTTAEIARIVHQETEVGAVAITDREKILAFVGISDDHHKPGRVISSIHTLKAIQEGSLVYADGYQLGYKCSLSKQCKLGSVLVIPLIDGHHKVLGTIKLYEPKRKLFSTVNLTLGEGIGKLLSNQILTGRYTEQQALLAKAELRLLQAQVNPHFLFNTLNTISAITRQDPEKARQLIQYLAKFFRRNLKQSLELVPIKEEIIHLNTYMEIELARFSDRLEIKMDIDDRLLNCTLPSFTLQPLIENAIKHGTSTLLESGHIAIKGEISHGIGCISITDNAGNFQLSDPDINKIESNGLGLQIVDKRLKNQFGDQFGLTITCEPQRWTKAKITFPLL
ncbi:sensor histidine kinase [Vibrio sp. SS-MA-C1-2]|uniref:sensor histidine kinase n=1 Tax=Vibrio sp. SS-MA-C1-2 TaxID=2908646 RepID=UPI001F2DDC92|nr:sensor histidine kinase [Vibrio sp. SS-MA-C1-2]UJF16890.1 sensor histidine kinase [Vibrio sp. SS-MA-C1-2]